MDRSVACLGGLSGLVGFFSFNFCCSVYTLYHVGMSVSFPTCVCVCTVSEGRMEACASFLKKGIRGCECSTSSCCSWHACGRCRYIVLTSLRSHRRTSTCVISF